MAYTYSVTIQADVSKVKKAIDDALKNAGKIDGSIDLSDVKKELESMKKEFKNLKVDQLKIQTIDSKPLDELKGQLNEINELIEKINKPQETSNWVSNLSSQISLIKDKMQEAVTLRKELLGNSVSGSSKMSASSASAQVSDTQKKIKALSKAYSAWDAAQDKDTKLKWSNDTITGKRNQLDELKTKAFETQKAVNQMYRQFQQKRTISGLTEIIEEMTKLNDIYQNFNTHYYDFSNTNPKSASTFKNVANSIQTYEQELDNQMTSLSKSAKATIEQYKQNAASSISNQAQGTQLRLSSKKIDISFDTKVTLENLEAQVTAAVQKAQNIINSTPAEFQIKVKTIPVKSEIKVVKENIKTGLSEIKNMFTELNRNDFAIPEITGIENLKKVAATAKQAAIDLKSISFATETITADNSKNTSKNKNKGKQKANNALALGDTTTGTTTLVNAGTAADNLLKLKTAIEELNQMTIQPKGLENLTAIAKDSKIAESAPKYIKKQNSAEDSKTKNTSTKKTISQSSSTKTEKETALSETKEIQLNAKQIQDVFDKLSSTLDSGLGKKFVEVVDQLKQGFSDINTSFSSFDFTQFSTDIQNVTNSLTTLVSLLKTASDEQLSNAWKDVQSAFGKLTDGDSLKSLRGSNNLNSQIGKDKNNFVALYSQYLTMGGSKRLEDLTYASGASLSKKDLRRVYSTYNNTSAKNTVTNMSALQGGAVSLQQISASTKSIVNANQQVETSDDGWESWLETLNQIRDALDSIAGTLTKVTITAKELNTTPNQIVVGEQTQVRANGRTANSITRKLDSSLDKSSLLKDKIGTNLEATGKIDVYYEKMRSVQSRLESLQTNLKEKRGLNVLTDKDVSDIKTYENELKILETEVKQLNKTSYDSTNTKGTLIAGTTDVDDIEKLEKYVRKNIVGNDSLTKSLTINKDKNSISGEFENAEGKLVSFKAELQSIDGENIGIRLTQSFKTVEKSIEQAREEANAFKLDNQYGKTMQGSEKVNNKGAMLSYLRKNLIGNNEVVKEFEVVGEDTVKGAFKDSENNIVSYTATLNKMGTTGENAGVRIKKSIKMATETVEEANAKLKQALIEENQKRDSRYGKVMQGSEKINNTGAMLSYLRKNLIGDQELTKGLTIDKTAGTVAGQIKQADGTLQNFKATLDTVGVSGENVGVRLKSSFKTIEDSVTQAKLKTEQAKILEKNDAKSSAIVGLFSNSSITGKTSLYGQTLDNVAQDYIRIRTAKAEIENKDIISEDDNNQLKVYNTQLDELISKLKKLQSDVYNIDNKKGELQSGTEYVNTESKLKDYVLSNDFLKGGKLISAEYRQETDNIVGSMKTIDGQVRKFKASIDDVNSGVRVLYTDQISASSTGLERFGTALGSLNKQLLSFVGTYRIAGALIQNLRQGFEFAREMDSALTIMSLTMDVTSSQLTSLGESSIQMAQELGTSVDSVVSVAQIYANMNETTESILASTKPTLYLTNAAGMDTSTAANVIQGVVQQYKELEGQEEHIVDSLETVSASMKMDFAIGIESMSDALERSGSIAREAGISFEELIGLAGKVTEVTRQSGEVTGSSLKTIFARLGRVTDDSEDALSASEVSNIAKAYKSVGISVYNADGSFVDATETLKKLSEIWDSLTDAQRSYVAEQSAGVRQKNTFLIMMDNYEDAMKLAEQAENSDGFAEGVQEKYEASMEAKLNTLKSTWQETMYGIFDGSEAKAVISFLTTLLGLFNKLAGVKVVGALSVFSGIFGGVLSAKGGGLINYDAKDYLKGNDTWKSGFSGIWTGFTSTSTAKKNTQMYNNVIDAYNANLINDSGKAYSDSIDILTKNMTRGRSVTSDYLKGLNGGVATLDGLIEAANAAGVSLGTLSVKQKLAAKAGSLLSTLGSSLASAGIAVAVNLAIAGLDKLIVTEKEAAEAAQEAQSAISDATNTYTNANKTVDEYLETYTRLGEGVKVVGNEIQNVSLTDSEFDEFLEANNALGEAFPEIVAGADAEGNSLLTLSTNATTAADSLQSLLEIYKQMQVDTIKENWKDLYTGAEKATNASSSIGEEKREATNNKNHLAAMLGKGQVYEQGTHTAYGGRNGNKVTYVVNDSWGETAEEVQEYLDKTAEGFEGNVNVQEVDTGLGGTTLAYTFTFDDEGSIEEFEQKMDGATNAQEEYTKACVDAADAQDKVDSKWKTLISTLSTMISAESGFSNLSDNMQNGVLSFVSNLSSSQLEAIGSDPDDMQAWVDKIYGRFTQNEGLYTELFDLESLKEEGNLTVQEYLDQRDEIIEKIGRAEGRDTEEIEIELGYKIKNEDTDEAEDEIKKNIEKTAKILSDKGSQVTEEDLYGLSYEDFEIVYSLVNEGETFDDVQSMMDAIEAQSIEIDVTTKLEDITNLKDIITEAAGNTGLTSESISTLKSMYADLYGDDGEKMYDALEFTSQGIRLNTDEILAFQEAQETVTKSNYMRQLSSLNSKYLEAADAISKLNHETEATSTELSGLKRQGDLSWWKTRADSLSDQIKSLRQAAAQFDGATSGYAKYQNALETPNEGATYEGAYTAIANAKKLYDNGDVGTDDFKTYVSMMTGISTSAPIEQIVQKYEASLGTIARYFTENAQGVVNFIADLDTLDDRIVTVQKDASGDIIGFDIKDDQQAADALGISLEALQMILYELRDKGWDVDIDDSTFLEKIANMQAAAIENQSLMQDLLEKNNYNVELNYTSNNVDDVVNQLNTVQSMRKAMVNEDGTIKVGVSQTDLDLVNQSLVALESQRYELTKPAIMDVDIDASTVSTQMADVLRVIQSYQTLAEQRQMTLMIGGDTSQIDKQMEEALTRFDELDIGTVTATLGMKTTDGTVVQNSSDFVNWFNNFGSGSIKLPTGVVSAENEDEVTPIEFETNVDSTKVDELFEKVDGEHIINFTTSVNGKKGVSSVFSSMAQTAKDASNKRLKEQNERANHSWKPEWNKTSDKTSSTKTTNTQITKYETKGAPSAIKRATQVSTAIKTVPLSRVSAFSTSGQKTVSSTASTLKEKLFSIPTSIASAISISVTGQEKLNTFTASLRTAVSRIQEYARAKAKGGLVNGTAHAFGTAFSEGSAFAHGDWSVHTNQTALVGELGREIIVRNGKWFSVGDNGAEFTSLRKGDIVFNNRQAEELLSKGYVTSNGGRGRAYVEGTAYSSGSGKFYGGAAKLKSTSKKVSTNRVNQAVNSAAQATTDFLDSLSSYFDFVEIKMTRLKSNTQRAISAIETAVSLAGAQQANAEALSKTQTELEYAQEAYQRYLSHANWIAQQTGLNAAYQSYIQNGRTDIVKFPENEQKAIDAYKEYWDKAEEVLDTIAELQEQEKELALQRLEIITEYYEAQSDNYDSNADMKSSSLEASKAQGKESSDVYYNTYSSMAVDYGNALSILQAEAENYQEEFNDLMERGYIVAGSTEYYEKLSEINDINEKVNDMLVKQLEALEDKYEATATFNEHLIDRLAETVDRYEAAIDLWETRGGEGNPDYFDSITSRYREEMLVNQEQIDRLSESIQSKYLALRKLGYEVGSEAYDNLVKEIEELEKKQLDLMTNNEEIIDSIREIRWTPFEQAQEEISYANEELEDLIGLLDSDAYVDEKTGALTSQGAAYIALISNEMDNYKQSIADYTEAVAKLNDELDSGLITQVQYNEYLEDYLSEIRSSISSVDGLRDSLIDLYKEQMQTEVDALQETIDKRKEALEAKKEYADYDKDIKNSQKTVNALKAQIAALEGVTNATGRAKLKSLQAELAEAEEDLQDKKDEHKYTIQVEGLETMSDDLQDDLDDTLYAITMNAEKQEEIIQNMLNNCVSMYAEAYKEIESIITNTGLILKDSLSNPDAIFDIVMNELTKTKDKTAGSYVRGIDTSNILYDNSSEKLAASILYDQLGHELGTLRSTLKSMGYYKTGTRNATAGVHKVNELGDELIFRYGGDDYTVLSKGDAVLPANLTNRIFDFATDPAKFIANNMPQGITNSSNNIIQVNYDRLVNIEGDATLDTVDAIQAMMPQITDQITKTLTKEYRKLH